MNAHDENRPSSSGDDSGEKDGNMTWDVTKVKESVEQVLKMFPDMALDKARSLLNEIGLRRPH